MSSHEIFEMVASAFYIVKCKYYCAAPQCESKVAPTFNTVRAQGVDLPRGGGGTRALKQRGNQTAAKRADISPLKTPIWGLRVRNPPPPAPPPPNRRPVDWRRHLANSPPLPLHRPTLPPPPLSLYFPSLTTWQPVLASHTRTAWFLARTVCADIRQQQQMTRLVGGRGDVGGYTAASSAPNDVQRD